MVDFSFCRGKPRSLLYFHRSQPILACATAVGHEFDLGAVVSTTSIEWTEVTWNPTTGCDRISPGCDNCYALTMAKRLKAMGAAKYQTDGDPRTSGPGFGVAVHRDVLTEPLRWRPPRMAFVNSMSDLSVGVSSIVCIISTSQRQRLRDRQVSRTAPIGLAA